MHDGFREYTGAARSDACGDVFRKSLLLRRRQHQSALCAKPFDLARQSVERPQSEYHASGQRFKNKAIHGSSPSEITGDWRSGHDPAKLTPGQR
jgi:hypothetical protein